MIELIIAVSLAITISAICSLFEAVLYSVPMRHIEILAQAGKPVGTIFKDLRRHVERPIAAILSLNTIANTAGAAFAGAAANAVFGHQWLGYFSALFTVAILVFSEILPKTVGVLYGRSLAAIVAYPLKGLVYIMAPAIVLSRFITRLVRREKHEDAITAEEIQVMAHLSRRSGGILVYQEQIIDSILTLQSRMVKDVMTPRTVMFSLSEHVTLQEAMAAAGGFEHSRIPIYDEGIEDVVGLVHAKDILMALAEGKTGERLAELMRPVHFVAETAKLDEVLAEFLELKQHLFVVIDEYGGLSGLISLEDILEEILRREIVDESDAVANKRELARQRRRKLQ